MRSQDFDYDLPAELIAKRPPPERDGGRLMVLGRDGVEHRRVRELAALLPDGCLLVVNDTRVLPARLIGRRRGSGGKVELLLLRREGATGAKELWQALGRASKPLRPGTVIDAEGLSAEVIERDPEGTLEVIVRAAPSVERALELHGRVPIPPYLERDDDADDAVRYQTLYARHAGSVAAPTAGLHFSSAILTELEARGVELAKVTLHVGLGTFRPMASELLDDHVMHSEWFEVSQDAAARVAAARARDRSVVAVGTTVVRTLESAADPERPGMVRAMRGDTALFIRPGYRFRVVDALLTNFHMPRSTLLALVSAFAGRSRLLASYGSAVAEGYRFLSYGDAMWIPSYMGETPSNVERSGESRRD